MFRKVTIAIGLGAVLTLTAWAATQQSAMGQGMMGTQGGMGQGMMTLPTQQGEPGTGSGPSTAPGTMGRWHRSGPGRSSRQASIYERPLISEILSLQGRLGLAASQVQRLQALRSGFEKEAIKRGAEIQAAEVDLSDLLGASPLDLAKIEDLSKKIGVLEGELRFVRIKTLEAGRAVLTQKQWEGFQSIAPGTEPMGAYGGRRQQGEMGPGMMGGYGGPAGMMGGYGGPGGGPGMMGGYGGPGAMMGPGPGLVYGKRTFASNGEQIYYTGVSRKTGRSPGRVAPCGSSRAVSAVSPAMGSRGAAGFR